MNVKVIKKFKLFHPLHKTDISHWSGKEILEIWEPYCTCNTKNIASRKVFDIF